MKLDSKALRYLANEDWKVLMACEQGTKNHEVVPTVLIQRLSGLRGAGSVNRCISNLAKIGLIAKVKNAKYDGYRLTYGGLDYLALHTFVKRKHIYSVGNQIGVGKESDIYAVADDTGAQRILKIHRLGRISFRAVKNQRDYLKRRDNASWMYMSRLAAQKEFAFMKILHDNGFPVPLPIDQARHCVVMELIDAFPMRQIGDIEDVAGLYSKLMALILKFASYGLIHGDFNEFNILVYEDTEEPVVIDFPQMISIEHPNAKEQFDRDVQCIKTFFERRFRFISNDDGPHFSDIKRIGTLDGEAMASGMTKKQLKELEKFMAETASYSANEDAEGSEEEDASDEDEESGDDASSHDENEEAAARSDGEESAVPRKM